ncbi:hypothetical protein EI427_04155 [Flammeovirga pectinis]|uniref:Polyketide cyclase n=1 Tax=Flammeovirga pectinis TaxID=2494373 RepID=A0A3Q9FJE0_9BACT|nr:SRPBCC family protein [Flammeovirga pectinis]AZQ61445.1 hypothetical protein EI427_04155 [Flammeovirga pectinis]
MIRYFSLGVLTVIALFFGIGMLLPSGYLVNQKVYINAPQKEVFEYIDNLHKWNDWAFKLEEEGSRLSPQYLGPDEGEGATHTWMSYDGSNAKLQITASNPFDEIDLQMITNDGDFVSDIKFTIEGSEKGTIVTWIEKGDFGFQPSTRVIAFISNYQERVSNQYASALEELKVAVEKKE